MKNLAIILVFVFSVFCSIGLGKAQADGITKLDLISIWDVKIGPNQTIGSNWTNMPSYKYTCRAEVLQFPNSQPIQKVLIWPNFMGPDTLVSKNTQCVLTSTNKALINRWLSEPMLYRQLTSNFYEGHRDLIEALQVRSFKNGQGNSKLVCRANKLGFYSTSYDAATDTVSEFKPRYDKALFAPNSTNWSPYQVFASRDLQCTTNVATINTWKKTPNWTWVEMPISN